MRILHVWDIAGVPCILAKYQNKIGLQAEVIMRQHFDIFGIAKFYNQSVLDLSSKAFVSYALKLCKDYDIIHVHALEKILPLVKLKYPRKKLVIHYHGSDIRGKARSIRSRFCRRFADKVILATKDLLDTLPTAVYLPNPIDTEHFVLNNNIEKKGAYVTIKNNLIDTERALKICRENGITDVVVYDRGVKPISHQEMPRFLNQYSCYVDIRILKANNSIINDFSKTALEALACGLSVFNWECRVVNGLPKEHDPNSVVKTLLEMYESL